MTSKAPDSHAGHAPERPKEKEVMREGEDKLEPVHRPTASAHESHAEGPLIQPLPWLAERDGEYGYIFDDNAVIVSTPLTFAEADFIVRAVNSHAELLSALRLLVAHLRREERWPVKSEHMAYLADAEAAIARAEGRG